MSCEIYHLALNCIQHLKRPSAFVVFVEGGEWGEDSYMKKFDTLFQYISAVSPSFFSIFFLQLFPLVLSISLLIVPLIFVTFLQMVSPCSFPYLSSHRCPNSFSCYFLLHFSPPPKKKSDGGWFCANFGYAMKYNLFKKSVKICSRFRLFLK